MIGFGLGQVAQVLVEQQRRRAFEDQADLERVLLQIVEDLLAELDTLVLVNHGGHLVEGCEQAS